MAATMMPSAALPPVKQVLPLAAIVKALPASDCHLPTIFAVCLLNREICFWRGVVADKNPARQLVSRPRQYLLSSRRNLTGVGFADLIQADTAVTTLHIGGIGTKVGDADILYVVYPGTTVTASDRRFVRDALQTIIQVVCLELVIYQ